MASNSIWLIRSSGHILGPFNRAEIVQMLRSKELVVLDEIAKPCDRFTYIRDQKQFVDIVEEIRKGHFRNDNTTTDVMMEKTATFTETVEGISDELTQEISTDGIDEIVYENVRESARLNPSQTVGSESFVFEGDRVVQQKANETVKLLWFVTVAIIFSVAGFVFFKKYVDAPKDAAKVAQAQIRQAISDLEIGEYEKALAGFKQAYEAFPEDPATYIYLGSLLIQVEGQTVQGKRLLQKVLDLGEKYPKRAITGLGLAALIDGDSVKADEYFDRALAIDPIYLPARINLGASALSSSDFSEANSHLHLAMKDGAREGAALVMLAESFIRLWNQDNQVDHLDQAETMLARYELQDFDYRQEASFLKLYVNHLKNTVDDPDSTMREILDMDPYQTRLHRHNVYIYRKLVNWKALLPWCEELVNRFESSQYSKALNAFCLINSGDRVNANRVIDDAVTQSPKDPLIQGVYAYILREIGLDEQASVAVGRSVEFDLREEYKLPSLLQARFCEEAGDTQCADEYWRRLLRLQPRSLPGIAGMAQNHIYKQDYAKAEEYLSRGQRLSRNYRPFLRLERKLEDLNSGQPTEPQGL